MVNFYVVNSFAKQAFGGNPAGVVPDAAGLSDSQMLAVAKQLNLVETAFVCPPEKKGSDIRIRYFTPNKELPIAGHPTIACWVALVEEGKFTVEHRSRYLQETKAGPQEIELITKNDALFVRMAQPEPKFIKTPLFGSDIADTFGIDSKAIVHPIRGVDTGLGHLIFGVDSIESLMKIRRQKEPLKKLCERFGLAEAQVFALEATDDNCDLHTRNICPREGLEDPACGVGNSALLAYLMDCGIRFTDDDAHMVAEQGHVVGMPSVIHTWGKRIDKDRYSMHIGGAGVIMAKGRIRVQ
ncbi:MAG: PhzF family phenazine biosynthesis protein [Bdellovibrionales bacterium]|nr:PhzF family phenazine biosynthesis protein [Bdellovibrionales bacterium]